MAREPTGDETFLVHSANFVQRAATERDALFTWTTSGIYEVSEENVLEHFDGACAMLAS